MVQHEPAAGCKQTLEDYVMSTAIEAFSRTIKTMADGTLRIMIDIEPMHARQAFELFGAPGTLLEVAALKPMQDRQEPESAEQAQADDGGELAQWAAERKTDQDFIEWLKTCSPFIDPEQHILYTCRINSLIMLDNDAEAAAIFHRDIRVTFAAWCAQHRPNRSAG